MSTTGVVILVAYAFTCGFFSAHVASKKGYDGGGWFLLGLLFNFVALIAVAGLPIVTDTLSSNAIYDKKEYERLKELLKNDNDLTEVERESIRLKKEKIRNKLNIPAKN